MSNQASFPVTFGAFDTTQNGANDVFVAKLNATGTGLYYATYLGGASNDLGHSIAVDAFGNAYVSGDTTSNQSTFPVTIGVFDRTYAGLGDVFVAKLNPTGTGLLYCTYLGGDNNDYGKSIALDPFSNVYVTGFTRSTG